MCAIFIQVCFCLYFLIQCIQTLVWKKTRTFFILILCPFGMKTSQRRVAICIKTIIIHYSCHKTLKLTALHLNYYLLLTPNRVFASNEQPSLRSKSLSDSNSSCTLSKWSLTSSLNVNKYKRYQFPEFLTVTKISLSY